MLPVYFSGTWLWLNPPSVLNRPLQVAPSVCLSVCLSDLPLLLPVELEAELKEHRERYEEEQVQYREAIEKLTSSTLLFYRCAGVVFSAQWERLGPYHLFCDWAQPPVPRTSKEAVAPPPPPAGVGASKPSSTVETKPP